MRLLRVIIILLILAIGGLLGYAYLGDMGAAPKEMRVPVQLDLGTAPQTSIAPDSTDAPAGDDPVDAAAAPAEDGADADNLD